MYIVWYTVYTLVSSFLPFAETCLEGVFLSTTEARFDIVCLLSSLVLKLLFVIVYLLYSLVSKPDLENVVYTTSEHYYFLR